MDIHTAIIQRRSIRRFLPKQVDRNMLFNLISLSRLYASGGNLQPIRYVAVVDQSKCNEIFGTLRWAAYLPDFAISDDSRPTAYIVLTSEKSSCQFDLGAAATTLMLAAEGAELGTCCIGSFNPNRLRDILHLQQGQEPLLVVALGYPAQKSSIIDYSGNIKYYEDSDGSLIVPKYTLDDVLTIY